MTAGQDDVPGAGQAAPPDTEPSPLAASRPPADTEKPAADTAEPAAGENEVWLRLSPRSLAVRPVIDLARLLPLLLGLIFVQSQGGSGNQTGLYIAALTIVLSVIRWATTRYRVTADRVYVQRGLVNQKVLSVARDRVRTVDLSAHLLYRIFGLRRVVIGTGRNDRRDGESFRLDALTLADAEALRSTLLARPPGPAAAGAAAADHAAAPGPVPTEIARLNPSWVRYAPFTLTGLVIFGVLAGAVMQFNDAAHIKLQEIGVVHDTIHRVGGLSLGSQILVIAVAALVLLTLVSSAGYLALFWNFRLTREPSGALRTSRGLLSTRATTIDAQRLRGAEISEPLLLRAAGGARCIAITTGLRVGRGAERGGSLIMPPAPSAAVRAAAVTVLGLRDDLTAVALTRHGPRAARRRAIRGVGGGVLAAAAIAVADLDGPAWIRFAALVLLPTGALLAVDRYRNLGHALTGRWLVACTGSLIRRRSILSTDGIVGWQIRQSLFQRRQGLVTLTAATAAGRQRYEVPDVPVDRALAVAHEATASLIGPLLAQ